jgi:prepilin-type N-terminal cleavage/methylation domain-containing protein
MESERGARASLKVSQHIHKYMLQKLHKNRGGFTLVEIMIVVAIIALLAAIAVPNFLRARKRSQATRIMEDLRMIDSAIDQYAIENNKATGNSLDWTMIQSYLKTGSVLYSSGGKDMLGGTYSGGTFSVDSIPKLDPNTYGALSDVAPPEFWSPFYP